MVEKIAVDGASGLVGAGGPPHGASGFVCSRMRGGRTAVSSAGEDAAALRLGHGAIGGLGAAAAGSGLCGLAIKTEYPSSFWQAVPGLRRVGSLVFAVSAWATCALCTSTSYARVGVADHRSPPRRWLYYGLRSLKKKN